MTYDMLTAIPLSSHMAEAEERPAARGGDIC